MEGNSKNLVIIVGNGFDIAHGHPTKYSDFADYFLQLISKKIHSYVKDSSSDTNFFTSNFKSQFRGNPDLNLNQVNRAFKALANSCIDAQIKKAHEPIYITLKKHYEKKLQLIITNNFISMLFNQDREIENWFDIETFYFELLRKNTLESVSIGGINSLNHDFLSVKYELQKYLEHVVITKNKNIESFLRRTSKNYNKVIGINFNYTLTFYNYRSSFKNFQLFNIHGLLEDKNIVFGYGNDQNEEYRMIVNLGIDKALDNFKTFDYLRNPCYSELMNELDTLNNYDINVVGHSLGVTDKTMLEEILVKDKCKRINLFKRSDYKISPVSLDSSFRALTYAASRIMENEKELRKKVVDQESALFFP